MAETIKCHHCQENSILRFMKEKKIGYKLIWVCREHLCLVCDEFLDLDGHCDFCDYCDFCGELLEINSEGEYKDCNCFDEKYFM